MRTIFSVKIVMIMLSLPSLAQVTSITGTSGQVNVSASTGAVTLSIPQSIGTTNTPTFGGLTLTGSLNTTAFVTSDASKTLINYTETETNIHARGNGGIIFKNNSNLQVGALSATGSLSLSGSISGQCALFEGNVGIGTIDPQGYRLAVNGNMIAESVKVKLNTNWPDYVFQRNYSLMPLSELEQYIKNREHLPDIPSAKEIKEGGLDLGNMNVKLLQKIEELTLHLIDLNKVVQAQQKEIEQLKSKL